MTDKLLEKKKKEFKREFPNLMIWVRESEKVSSEYNIQEVVWDWIEKLVEEVEREAMKEGWNRAVLTVNDAEQERLKYLKKWLPIKAKEIETN